MRIRLDIHFQTRYIEINRFIIKTNVENVAPKHLAAESARMKKPFGETAISKA